MNIFILGLIYCGSALILLSIIQYYRFFIHFQAGHEATTAIRSLSDPAKSQLPIVAMSANAFAEDVKASLDAGMNTHVAKPVDAQILRRTLEEILA